MDATETSSNEPVMRGTPITRSGGYLIRVGWRKAGYSVDRRTESSFRRAKIMLFILALAVGIAVAAAVDYVFQTFIAGKASQYIPLIKNSPTLWQLLIYGFTLLFGGLIYLQIVAKIGQGMAKGHEQRDQGYSLVEQRQHAAVKWKGRLFLGGLYLGLSYYATVGEILEDLPYLSDSTAKSVLLFTVLLVIAAMLEAIIFRFVIKGEKLPH